MEITSFVLGVCAVIILLMVAGTSVNYMVTRELKKEIEYIKQVQAHQARDLDEYNNMLLANIKATRDELAAHTDSRVDKLSNALNDIIKEHEVNLNYNKEKADTNANNIKLLLKEIGRVENGYKEKINY
jgi:hypothetical protein